MKIIFFATILFLSTHFVSGQIAFSDFEASLELNNLARAEFNKKQYNTAINYLQKAIKLDSTNRSAHINLCLAYYQKKEFELMYSHLEQAKQIFLEDDEIFYHSGNALQKLGKLSDAIDSYSQAIKYSKVNGEDFPLVYAYYLNRGICFFHQQKYELALEDFNYTLKLNENSSPAYSNRGHIYFILKKTDEACADWKRAKELGESKVSPYITKHCKN